MLRRRAIKLGMSPPGPASAPASAAGPGRRVLWAVEERVVWGGADALRGVVDAISWPFERAAWTIERGLIWPLEERTSDWSGPLRAAGVAAVAAVAVAAGALGLAWTANSGTGSDTKAAAPIAAPVAQPPQGTGAPAAPLLRGAAPDFTPKDGGGASKVAGAKAVPTSTAATGSGAPASSPSSAAASDKPAGPAAIEVARQFAGAFVLYETGRDSAKVRAALAETATPRLARSLLRRPPRLPANAKVPRAKVLNIVPGPHHGDTYTLSISLLRVGVTSELRVGVQRGKAGSWRITDVLG